MLNHWDHRTLLKTIDKRKICGENGEERLNKVSTDRYNWWNRTDSTARSNRTVLPALFALYLSSLDLAVENQIWTKRNETERITITIRLNIRNNYTSYFTWNVWVSVSGVVCAPDSSRYVGSAKAIGIVHGMLWASEWVCVWTVRHRSTKHVTIAITLLLVLSSSTSSSLCLLFSLLF